MINNYHFNNQLRAYLLQFVSIFYGLKIQTGVGECDVPEMITVPMVIGHRDRVVAAIQAGNTQNRVYGLPTMAANLVSITPAPSRRKVQAYVDQRTTLPAGGVFPSDLTVVKRAMPIPYDISVDLSIFVSNLQQRDQILEQILVLFNPDLQIQKSDGPFDWTKLTTVELTDISNEENFPSGADRRIIQWTLTFTMPIFLSIPMGVKDDLVRKIIIRLGDLDSMTINEVDDDGHIIPFGDTLATVKFDTTDPTSADYYEAKPKGPTPPEPSSVDYP